MSQIAVILTGGTIASVFTPHATAVTDGGTATLQHEVLELLGGKNNISFHRPFTKASENFEPVNWLAILRQIEEIRASGTTRFLITHGTDTLAYTAALLSLYYGKSDLTICLVAAFYPLADLRSDIDSNLAAAAAVLTEKNPHKGVFVPFRGMGLDIDAPVALHHGLAIKPMQPDAVSFTSFYDAPAGFLRTSRFDKVLQWRKQEAPDIHADFRLVSEDVLVKANARMVMTSMRPGLDFRTYESKAREEDIVLVCETYHSGTAFAEDRPGSAIDFMRRNPGSNVVFAPYPAHLIDKPYESTLKLMDAGAAFYRDLQPHTLYMLGTLGLAHGRNPREALLPAKNWRLGL